MTRVLFVCLGNICRSPMAHGLFTKLADERGVRHRFEVDSAGTAAHHAGERPDSRTLAVLRSRGAPLDHRARRVEPEDFEQFDWLLVMDGSNLRALHGMASPEHRSKVRRVLEPVGGGDVPDPYYGGPEGFVRVERLLDGALRAWLDDWLR